MFRIGMFGLRTLSKNNHVSKFIIYYRMGIDFTLVSVLRVTPFLCKIY